MGLGCKRCVGQNERDVNLNTKLSMPVMKEFFGLVVSGPLDFGGLEDGVEDEYYPEDDDDQELEEMELPPEAFAAPAK